MRSERLCIVFGFDNTALFKESFLSSYLNQRGFSIEYIFAGQLFRL